MAYRPPSGRSHEVLDRMRGDLILAEAAEEQGTAGAAALAADIRAWLRLAERLPADCTVQPEWSDSSG